MVAAVKESGGLIMIVWTLVYAWKLILIFFPPIIFYVVHYGLTRDQRRHAVRLRNWSYPALHVILYAPSDVLGTNRADLLRYKGDRCGSMF